MRIAQISDTHLSFRRPFFHHNWELLVELLNNQIYDLIVCTGDMTADGSDHEDELAFAREQFERIKTEVLFVPGNHDLGNSHPDVRGGEPLINSERRKNYIRYFGVDFWCRDVASDWRFIGINSMLFGSGEPAEEEQNQFIENSIASRDERMLFFFMHKPLYMHSFEEDTLVQSCLHPDHRFYIKNLLKDIEPVHMTCGHIHDYKLMVWDNIKQIRAPSTAFVVDAAGLVRQQPKYGVRRVGFLELDLADTHPQHQFIEPDTFVNIDLGNWLRAPQGFISRYGKEPFLGDVELAR